MPDEAIRASSFPLRAFPSPFRTGREQLVAAVYTCLHGRSPMVALIWTIFAIAGHCGIWKKNFRAGQCGIYTQTYRLPLPKLQEKRAGSGLLQVVRSMLLSNKASFPTLPRRSSHMATHHMWIGWILSASLCACLTRKQASVGHVTRHDTGISSRKCCLHCWLRG